ncbi:sialidase domain-containing protein [Streptococcus merionis]|uniref:sialidase domain-containing protein n=1 Tax=Streptococcus merionis TaxID=400065 RepID=UPI003516E5B9
MKYKKWCLSLGALLLFTPPFSGNINVTYATENSEIHVEQSSGIHLGPYDLNNQGLDVTEDILGSLKSDTQTIVVKFSADRPNTPQVIFSLSNSSKGFRNNYFSIFTRDTGEIGVEIRDAQKGINYLFTRPASLWGKHLGKAAENTLVFTSDATNKTYTMYANGSKIFSEYVENFLPITGIEGQNTATIGGINREGNLNQGMVGSVSSLSLYNRILSEEEISGQFTSSLFKLPFYSGDATQANYFRIPALYTLQNGRVIASIDARYGGTHDSKSKINIATSYSDTNGETWSSPNYAMKFNDYAEQTVIWPRGGNAKNIQINGSASFIDSALVQDKSSGKVIILADVMPAGIGNGNANKSDSGFKEIDGNFYIKLSKQGERAYNFSIREDGVIYDDNTNKPTNYSVNSKYELLENHAPLSVEQYSVEFSGDRLNEFRNGTMVPMNIFYKDSLFKVAATNYIGVSTSDDNGESWSDFTLLPPFHGVNHNATYLSPGQGLALSDSNRIIFATYTSGELTYLITEDGGTTWKSTSAPIPFTNATAEAQMVELRPGVIRTFFRTTTGKIGYMTSYDSGNTWSEVSFLDMIHQTNYGTQVSAIKYSQPIEGKEAVILSTTNSTSGRRNGQIWVGLVDSTNDTIDWKYHYDVDLPKFGFAYSALTELPNHRIGLLFEKYDSWSRNELHLTDVVQYVDYDINDLLK